MTPPNKYNSNIKDRWSQIIIKNHNSEKVSILQYYWMWHRDRKWVNAFEKVGTERLYAGLIQTLNFVNKVISTQHNKAECCKTRLCLYWICNQKFCLHFEISFNVSSGDSWYLTYIILSSVSNYTFDSFQSSRFSFLFLLHFAFFNAHWTILVSK